MRVETLLNPGLLSNGVRVRTEAAKAISACEITAGRTPGGKTRMAAALQAFFTDCASKLAAIADAVAPVLSAQSGVATSATEINITFAEAMDNSVVAADTAFTVNNGGVVTTVVWFSTTVLRITGTGFAAGDIVTYTKPATNFLRDRFGNAVATGTNTVA